MPTTSLSFRGGVDMFDNTSAEKTQNNSVFTSASGYRNGQYGTGLLVHEKETSARLIVLKWFMIFWCTEPSVG
jgi:hypothetical protein